MNPYWSYLLTIVGVFGLWLAGRKDRRGWMVGIGAQSLWIAYATATHQWGFYVSALAYGWVYIKNARAWKSVESERVMTFHRDEPVLRVEHWCSATYGQHWDTIILPRAPETERERQWVQVLRTRLNPGGRIEVADV